MNQFLSKSNTAITRRNFLKLATGTAIGTAMFQMPFLSYAKEDRVKSRTIQSVLFTSLPREAQIAAKSSPMVNSAYEGILAAVNTIQDSGLRERTLQIIKNPVPTFMQEYTTSGAISQLYKKLSDQGLINTSKISEKQLLPPFTGTSPQPFMTAPGSGYGSHHAYPGGLATHVGVNLHITQYICKTYEEVFFYKVHRDIAVAGQALHDIEKPFVFQWQEDGTSLPEYTIAGQGAHHVISLAEVIYRGFPPEEVVAQACAHGAPTSAGDEADVVGWLKAAALMAGKDPVNYGLLNLAGDHLPAPHHQEGYIVHLGDHDWVLSVPAAQKAVVLLKKIAAADYGMKDEDLNGLPFNAFRNYIGAQVSLMYIQFLSVEPDGYEQVRRLVHKIVIG